MIEVEKKFQPSQSQLESLLHGAIWKGSVENKDSFYDTRDFDFNKRGIKLRERNGEYDLKIEIPNTSGRAQTQEEVFGEAEIVSRLGYPTGTKMNDVVSKLEKFASFITKREKYEKEGFAIDVDTTDYGYNMVEIELILENDVEVDSAERSIIEFATREGLDLVDLPGKMSEYLRTVKPELYKLLYENRI